MSKEMWKKLLSTVRPYDIEVNKTSNQWGPKSCGRTSFEKDYDRVLFSTPFRRLIDKTQVFPLERNYDSVHRRLTHSYEVSNIARSLGRRIVYNNQDWFPEEVQAVRNIPAILATTGLIHDIGNPPIGHSGENAIRNWAENKKESLNLEGQELNDLLKFEGNAQMLRLLSKLQIWTHKHSLNLTLGTLYSAMKYTANSLTADKNSGIISNKKVGYFKAEEDLVKNIKEYCSEGDTLPRHPLSFILEAADDICYSVMDVEDSIKKGIISIYDVCDILKSSNIEGFEKLTDDFEKFHPSDKNDVGAQKFRNMTIGILCGEAYNSFTDNYNKIMDGEFDEELLHNSTLKSTLKKKIFEGIILKDTSIARMEAMGYKAIYETLDILWTAIIKDNKERLPADNYALSKISNVFMEGLNDKPTNYDKVLVVTDMVSGMTDGYLMKFYEDLTSIHDTDSK